MTILKYGVPASIGAFSFTDVVKVKYAYFNSLVPTITEEKWFAKDVGLINYLNASGISIFQVSAYKIF